jgi:hypothetical protein
MASLTPEQQRVRGKIVRIGRQRRASPKEIKAAIETGLVEANLTNPSGGDADSAGWRQERASLYSDPTNLDASINRFYDETKAVAGKYARAGDLAAAVQRPAAQYRGRYQEHSAEAQSLLGGSTGTGTMLQADVGRTTTTAGVDNSRARAALVQNFLGNHNSDPIDFALGIRAAQDVPGRTTVTPASLHQSALSVSDGHANLPAGHSQLLELIHNTGKGAGYAVKNGQRVNGPQFYSGVWAGHANHVHVAAGPDTVIALGKLAQKMGLQVGENPHFGGVHPVHVPGSYHNKGEAIDVSGDPGRMNAYAAAVERMYGLKR